MAAVTPQTILCEIERLSPAGSVVEAATAPSPRTLETMAVQRTVNQTITPEKTIFHKTPYGKLHRIYKHICVFENFFDFCSVIKITKEK